MYSSIFGTHILNVIPYLELVKHYFSVIGIIIIDYIPLVVYHCFGGIKMDTFNLKSIMKIRGIGNKELAEKSGIPLGTLNKIIYGDTKKPTLDNMIAISKALKCTLDDFVDGPFVKDHISISDQERRLLDSFSKLNEEGQNMAIEYAEYLITKGYIKSDTNRMVERA